MKKFFSKSNYCKSHYGYFFVAPFFIVFIIFGLYPIIYTMILSMQKWDGLMPAVSIGFSNFNRLITDEVFYLSVWNTIRIWLLNFIPQMFTALLLSALFTFNKIKGMKFFRASYYLPNLITAASVGLLFNLLFNGNSSIANNILMHIGIIDSPLAFFNSPLFTSSIVSYIQWWMWFGYTTIIILAGMTSIDGNLYKAAMVDGAGKIRTYIHITLPLIRPTLTYLTITSIIGGMQLFDVPATLTNGYGDPQKSILTTSMYIYNQAFKSHNFGYASAVSLGLFIIVLLLSVISFRLMNIKEGFYHG